MTFEELGLREEVLKSLKELGFEAPTPIQEQAIPHLMKDDCDFVGLAQTGTGKTAAFGLPLINSINAKSNRPQGLIICPTRELCLQITRDLEIFSKYVKCPVVSVYGGADIRRQMTQIKKGAAIIVATPGRLLDLIKRKAIQLSEVQNVVLDEALDGKRSNIGRLICLRKDAFIFLRCSMVGRLCANFSLLTASIMLKYIQR